MALRRRKPFGCEEGGAKKDGRVDRARSDRFSFRSIYLAYNFKISGKTRKSTEEFIGNSFFLADLRSGRRMSIFQLYFQKGFLPYICTYILRYVLMFSQISPFIFSPARANFSVA